MINLLIKAGDNINAKLQWCYWPLLMMLCVFSLINFIRVGYVLAQNWNGWMIGDWLLNYEHGFIRRGLFGAIIVGLNQYLDFQINYFIFMGQCAIFLLFLVTFMLLLINKSIGFWYVIACLAPGFLLFNYYDGMSVGRKEILLYAVVAIWCLVLQKYKPSTLTIAVFATLLFALTLSHEMVLFFVPYFIVALWLSYPPKAKHDYMQIIALAVSPLLAIGLLFLLAYPISEHSMCATFLKLGAREDICQGIISYGTDASLQAVWLRLRQLELGGQLHFIALIPVIVAPFYLTIRVTPSLGVKVKKIRSTFFGLFCFTIPLFLVSVDWGRWLAIHITLFTIILAQHLPTKQANVKQQCANVANVGRTAGAAHSNILLLLITAASIVAFNFSYSLNHCCANNMIEPFGPVKKLLTTFRRGSAF